jgi:hypothetical protein
MIVVIFITFIVVVMTASCLTASCSIQNLLPRKEEWPHCGEGRYSDNIVINGHRRGKLKHILLL